LCRVRGFVVSQILSPVFVVTTRPLAAVAGQGHHAAPSPVALGL